MTIYNSPLFVLKSALVASDPADILVDDLELTNSTCTARSVGERENNSY